MTPRRAYLFSYARRVAAVTCLWAAPVVAQEAAPLVYKPYPLATSALMLDVASTSTGLVAVGERGFVLTSPDGAQWTQVASPATTMLTAVAMGEGGKGWAVGHDAVIMSTIDNGASWSVVSSAPELETPLFDVWFENDQHGMAVGAYGLVMTTTDGGITWTEIRVGADELHLYAIAAAPDGGLYLAGEAGTLLRSDDQGANWTQLESPYEGSFFGLLALQDGGLLTFGLRGNLFRSDDRGATWTQIDTDTEASLMGGVQRKDGSVIVTGLSGTVLASADGRTFTLDSLQDREALAGAYETAAGTLLVYGEKGPHPLAGNAP